MKTQPLYEARAALQQMLEDEDNRYNPDTLYDAAALAEVLADAAKIMKITGMEMTMSYGWRLGGSVDLELPMFKATLSLCSAGEDLGSLNRYFFDLNVNGDEIEGPEDGDAVEALRKFLAMPYGKTTMGVVLGMEVK